MLKLRNEILKELNNNLERILLLESSGFPEKFENIDVNPSVNLSKQKYVEQEVLKSINKYNTKLKIKKIVYDDITKQFPRAKVSKFTGLIVEDIEISQCDIEKFKEKEYFVWQDNNQWFARKIVIYVFLSEAKEKGRNILFTQSIFPAIIDYIEEFYSSPSYTLANHPIYFINIINKKITANSLLRRLASLIVAQFEYIEVFEEIINPQNVPMTVEGFIRNYEKEYNSEDTTFSSNFYTIDFNLKKLILNTNKLVVGDYLKINDSTGKYVFNGSAEKFYWMEILPMVILACRNEYDIDYSKLEKFYNSNINNFPPNDDKFQRFNTLIKYIKKITFN